MLKCHLDSVARAETLRDCMSNARRGISTGLGGTSSGRQLAPICTLSGEGSRPHFALCLGRAAGPLCAPCLEWQPAPTRTLSGEAAVGPRSALCLGGVSGSCPALSHWLGEFLLSYKWINRTQHAMIYRFHLLSASFYGTSSKKRT